MKNSEVMCEAIEKAFPGECKREFRFHSERRWRFDCAVPRRKLAFEYEGAVFTAGRHSRGAGIVKDAEKYNEAALLGWTVIRLTSKDFRSVNKQKVLKQSALDWILRAKRFSGE